MSEDYSLENLKKDYSKLQKEYSLPNFKEINENFSIEKISETELLLREVRKFMAEKFINYLRFIEVLLQPSNAPIYIYSIVKCLDSNQKQRLAEIYKQISKLQLKIMVLDVDHNEKEEAEFIVESFKIWSKIKKEFLDLIKFVEANWENKSPLNSKGYFG